MRVGLLTYHYVCNEGALWQAFSLLRALQKFAPGIDASICNFELNSKADWNRKTFGADKQIAFQKLRSEFIDDSSISERELANLDGLIVGSDIVWQFSTDRGFLDNLPVAFRSLPRQTRASSPANWLRGLKNRCTKLADSLTTSPAEWLQVPNPYWLPWKSSQRKISFATSIGYSRPEHLTNAHRSLMRELLVDFDLISVRDNHTKAFVEGLLQREVTKIADPAWLYDEALVDVSTRLRTLGWDENTPLAGVLYPRGNRYGSELDCWVNNELRRQGFETVSVIDANPAVDYDLAATSINPFEWWSLIANLDFLLTVRTHPNIAAIKYHTPFLNLDITSALNASAVSKSADMLAEFGLERFCLYRPKELKENCIRAKLREALVASWDWRAVDSQILTHRQTAVKYIGRIEKLFDGNHR